MGFAVQTEGRARLNVACYAALASDPLLRKAIELNAFEEGRHSTCSPTGCGYGIALRRSRIAVAATSAFCD